MPKPSKNIFRKQIQKAQELKYDWWLVWTLLTLCTLGVAFLASSLSTETQLVYTQELTKQVVLGLGLGIVFSLILAKVDYHFILKQAKILLVINFILLGFLAFFALYANLVNFGQTGLEAQVGRTKIINSFQFLPVKPFLANGALRWIDFPILPNFQPSEFTKLALLVYFSSFFGKWEGKKISWVTFKNPIYAFLASAVLIMIQPDLGTVLIIFGILAASMWSAKIPVKILFYLGIVVIAVGVFMSFAASYRVSRITAFLDPESSNAAQIRNVQRAIQNGGFFGKGYGNSELKQQPGVLYEQSTDAIIAIIGEEMGFIGTSLFLSLYLILLWRGLKIAQEAPDLGGQALATGVTVWIVGQAFLNITGMTGLTPLKGVPLPFVSQGGSSLFINLLASGLLLNVSSQAQSQKVKATLPIKNSLNQRKNFPDLARRSYSLK